MENILKYLEISTAHVTRNDDLLLQDEMKDVPGCAVYPYEGGYFLSLGERDEDREKDSGFSPDFFRLMNYARVNECNMIRLDCDGDQLDPALGFTTFDW